MLLTLTLTLAALQDPPPPPPDPAQEREAAALDAYDAFSRENRPAPGATPEQVAERAKGLRARLAAFAEQWTGTAASYRALLDAAGLDLHLLNLPDDGLKLLSGIYDALKARTEPLPQRARLSAGLVGLQYAEELLRLERYGDAEPVLEELAAAGGPEKARARAALRRLPLLRSLAIGQPLPAFTGTDLDGQEARLADFAGKVLLLDFWATWCGPCRVEMPHLVAAYQQFHEQGFEILGVSLDQADSADAVRAFATDNHMPWRQIYDGGYHDAALARQYLVQVIPASILVDRKGVIRHRNLRGAALAQAVGELLAEP
ncbi:MAG: TlpA family protein disulfide reductase [Planctomycetota bacterium]|nr:MAG: TlpA family protein disulfide reductase [Planctomycetota bacterium]